jgi:hypothetical protein
MGFIRHLIWNPPGKPKKQKRFNPGTPKKQKRFNGSMQISLYEVLEKVTRIEKLADFFSTVWRTVFTLLSDNSKT